MKGQLLRRASLVATLGMTSHAEIAAGVAAGMPMWHPVGANLPGIGLPWLLPIAIDCYVVEALENRNGPDRWAALAVLTASVVGGSVAVADTPLSGAIVAGIGTVLVVVLSRLYAKPKPSKAEAAERLAREAAERERERTEEARATAREREASRLRIEEAAELARIEARRIHDTATAEAERIRAGGEAEWARLEAESAAEVARIHANAAANREPSTANPKPNRSRTPQPPPANPTPPAKDDAVRKVAAAIREHAGDTPYVFDWTAWRDQFGGGKTFWWGVHKAATEPVHLAEAAS